MTNEIIVVKQLPVIEEQLRQIKAEIESKVAAALAMECTEETVKQVKTIRADLRKDYKELEDKRTEVKKAILAPYEQFNEIYRACVSDIFTPADTKLAGKIAEVEDGLKEIKRKEVVAYFEEYKISKGIDFLSFADADITVTLTATKKALKEKAKAFLDRISDELALIDTDPFKAEILVEYKHSLNVAQAIPLVRNRHKAIEEEQAALLAAEEAKSARAAATAKVDEILVSPSISQQFEEQLPPPVEVSFTAPNPSKQFEATFKVTATLSQLKELKEFLTKGGYKYVTVD